MSENIKPPEENQIIRPEIINMGNNISQAVADYFINIIEKSYESFPSSV